MITKDKMMPLLIEACPSFQGYWEEFLAEWADEPEDLPLYIALSDFARHLIDFLARGDTKSFAGIFEVVERLHLEGDKYVREAATIGLLAVQRKVVSRFARKFGMRKRLRFSIAFPRRNIQLEVQNAFSTCFRSA